MFLFFLSFNDANIQSLIEKAKKGDEGAFCSLVRDLEPYVYNLALRLMNGNRQDAEDMAQEAFLRVYKALPGYKENSSLKTWTLHICKNVCLDEIRKRKVRINPVDDIPETKADTTDVQEEIISAERRKNLIKAINSLDERAKLLIVMRDINGLSYDEIGQALYMNIGTVKSSLNRARKRLRKILTEQNLN